MQHAALLVGRPSECILSLYGGVIYGQKEHYTRVHARILFVFLLYIVVYFSLSGLFELWPYDQCQ